MKTDRTTSLEFLKKKKKSGVTLIWQRQLYCGIMVIMSFRGCTKITCPLRWLLVLLGFECCLPKTVSLTPGSGRRALRKHDLSGPNYWCTILHRDNIEVHRTCTESFVHTQTQSVSEGIYFLTCLKVKKPERTQIWVESGFGGIVHTEESLLGH